MARRPCSNYTANIGGQTVNGSLIATPTKEKGKYAIIAVQRRVQRSVHR